MYVHIALHTTAHFSENSPLPSGGKPKPLVLCTVRDKHSVAAAVCSLQ